MGRFFIYISKYSCILLYYIYFAIIYLYIYIYNDNDNQIILFRHKKNSKILNIVDICIMLIMLVIDILVCSGDLISAL